MAEWHKVKFNKIMKAKKGEESSLQVSISNGIIQSKKTECQQRKEQWCSSKIQTTFYLLGTK